MRFAKKRWILWGMLAISIVMTACVPPAKEDPFSRLPEEKIETLEGEVFPFSVSVSTRATHRLESNNRLVALLASEIVRLEDFEGQEVEMDGVRKTEKMREIFWVEAVRVKNLEKGDEGPFDLRFETKKFSFPYPESWEYTTSPDGTAYFVDKDDPARRVFLMFSVKEISRRDKRSDPNVLIANLAGTKKNSTDELGRERQEITLFSNLFDRKYGFVFTSSFEEFEKKKSFFRLLNSFIEGEENVRKAKEEDLKKLAEQEAEKITNYESQITDEKDEKKVEKATEEDESEGILSKLFGKKPTAVDESESSEEKSEVEQKPLPVSGEFQDLIDEKAFSYESAYYQFSMQVPFGFWFRNFGQSENVIARIGFSDQDFTGSEEAKFWLEILGDENPPKAFSEQLDNDTLVIEFPRGKKSFFRLRGSKDFRDAMRSIHATVKNF